MILNNLSRAIREQNWFAVAIEFIIVVIGVAVGFQLTGYYEERRRAAAEAEYLSGIATDFGVYQSLLICLSESEQEIARGVDHLITEIEGETLTDNERLRVLYALTVVHFGQAGVALEGNAGVLMADELVETIKDDELRALILATHSISTSSMIQLGQLHDHIVATPRFDTVLQREQSPDSGGFYGVAGYDLAAMQADPSIRDRLINLANYHRATDQSVSFLLGYVGSVLTRLEELGAREAPEETPSCLYNSLPTRDLE